jgi:hypothetical protein
MVAKKHKNDIAPASVYRAQPEGYFDYVEQLVKGNESASAEKHTPNS